MINEYDTEVSWPQIYMQANVLVERLLQFNLHISCAESCTGGGISYALTSVAGSSGCLKQSFVVYSNEAKQTLLKVPGTLLVQHGAVSEQVVAAMANELMVDMNSISVAVSGIAGPDGGSEYKPVGTVWFGFGVKGQLYTELCQFTGDREQVRLKAILYVLNYLIKSDLKGC